MQYKAEWQELEFEGISCYISVPDYAALKENYISDAGKNSIPYWAKLWPSAIALCRYIAGRQAIFHDKTVLELAAGLGLPSMLAARFSRSVICSDYAGAAVAFAQASVEKNGLQNVSCRSINWHRYPAELEADIVLLSDINYDPAEFEVLNNLLLMFLQRGTLVILSTPQRIMAKPFIEGVMPYCKEKDTVSVEIAGETAEIFIMQLEIRH